MEHCHYLEEQLDAYKGGYKIKLHVHTTDFIVIIISLFALGPCNCIL